MFYVGIVQYITIHYIDPLKYGIYNRGIEFLVLTEIKIVNMWD